MRASSGQEEYQSRVQQFTKLGNFEQRNLSTFPTGDIHKATWRFSLDVEIKCAHFSSGVPSIAFFVFGSFKLLNISFLSSSWNKLGISPEFSKLLISSRKVSSMMVVSVTKNVFFLPFKPVYCIRLWTCSLNYLINSYFIYASDFFFPSPLMPWVIFIVKVSQPRMKLPSLVRVCLPLPPTPISIALPLGWRRILAIRRRCYTQALKKTKSILDWNAKL